MAENFRPRQERNDPPDRQRRILPEVNWDQSDDEDIDGAERTPQPPYKLKPIHEHYLRYHNPKLPDRHYCIIEFKYYEHQETPDGPRWIFRPPRNHDEMLDYKAKPTDTVKYLVCSFEDYFRTPLEDINGKIGVWASREKGWRSKWIPKSPFAFGCLRIQVWNCFLPVPSVHFKEMAKRLEFLKKSEFMDWFLRNARGHMPPNPNIRRAGQDWCALCGCCWMGFPTVHHSADSCPLRHMDKMDILHFLAVNSIAFCNFCGARSATHKDCTSTKTNPVEPGKRFECQICRGSDHRKCQKNCVLFGEPVSSQDQKEEANRFRKEYFLSILRKVETQDRHDPNAIQYFIPLDVPNKFYQQWVIENNIVPIGWGIYMGEIPDDGIKPALKYPNILTFRGLVSPESDSAHTNHYPVFLPEEMDMIDELADDVDWYRFGEISTNHPGTYTTSVIPEYMNQRAQLRARNIDVAPQREERAPEVNILLNPIENQDWNRVMEQEGIAQDEAIIHEEDDANAQDEFYHADNVLILERLNRLEDPVFGQSEDSLSVKTAESFESFDFPRQPKESIWFRGCFPLEYSSKKEKFSTGVLVKKARLALNKPRGAKAEIWKSLAEFPMPQQRDLVLDVLHVLLRELSHPDMEPSIEAQETSRIKAYAYYLQGAITLMSLATSISPRFDVKFTDDLSDTAKSESAFVQHLPTMKLFVEMGINGYWTSTADENWPLQLSWLQDEVDKAERAKE